MRIFNITLLPTILSFITMETNSLSSIRRGYRKVNIGSLQEKKCFIPIKAILEGNNINL